jgi:outer membrane protein insertion porin family
MRRAILLLLFVTLPAVARAQSPAAAYVGRTVTSVEVYIEGKPANEPALADVIQTKTGQPLSIVDVRETMAHLFSFGRFQDVRVDAADAGDGVRLRYDLIPVHGVQRIEFAGELGLSESLLRRTVTERFGATPPAGRSADVVRTLDQIYKDRGYWTASITPKVQELHDPDRSILTFDIQPGPRAHIGRVEIVGTPVEGEAAFLRRIGVASGVIFERGEIQKRLADYVTRLKKGGRYEAAASQRQPQLSENGAVADITIDVQPGPIVKLAFEGDALPADKLDDLVPVEREGSADEDLLEDSAQRIEQYLQQQGYWKAHATFDRKPSDGTLTIVFTVRKGLLYRIAGPVEISGNGSIPLSEIQPLIARLRPDAPYLASELTAAASAIAGLYRLRGHAQVKVDASENAIDAVRPGEGLIRPAITIAEGPLIRVGSVVFEGNAAVPEQELRPLIKSTPGEPYFAQQLAADRDSVLVRYLNMGFASANVAIDPRLSADGARVDLHFRISEGPQTLVDHIIIVGNQRTSPQVIQRELLLRTGEPLGLEDRIESQRRLGALGLFRRVRVQPLSHGEGNRQDVLVTVEEAPPTTVGYGGGLEASRLLRPGPGGEAQEQFEFAPRGFFDIGRRNLGGKNRSINLYTRFSLRPDDDASGQGSRFGFIDYRVVTTYRQPRLAGANDVTVTSALEQGVRSSFNFARKGINAELNRRLKPGVRAGGRYSLSSTKTVNKGLSIEDPTSIDRLFPQVRLSLFSGAISRDTRDDLVDPARGTFLSAEGTVAARAIGGQVGFMKSYVQAFWFRRLPGQRRTVLASRVALGLADGFKRTVETIGPDGQPIDRTVEDLPASERFFAGGDTTIRGFALDTVGQPATISATGFPTGGNAVIIMNAELRVPVWGDLGGVVFVDGGNVFERATQFDLGELRGSLGFGVRYKSPIGPVRVDLGFKMDRRELGGKLEPRRAIHFSIGHAF